MSTAKSMAAQYRERAAQGKTGAALASKQRAFKSSASNLLHSSRVSLLPASTATEQRRLNTKATSMTNLAPEEQAPGGGNSRIQRPASRGALDSIHMGMNAKYAQVQSKVLLQNIRPQAPPRSSPKPSGSGAAKKSAAPRAAAGPRQLAQQGERAQLLAKLASLEEQLGRLESERRELSDQLERERAEAREQARQLKQQLQDKAGEHERQQEEFHQRLLEAYELADENRRAADNVLAESRQRDEQSRKKVEELEQQLGELRDFVAMKEEMSSKMSELRQQIRDERERYEEKTRTLSQLFESEKIR